jgi:hypothetical protein
MRFIKSPMGVLFSVVSVCLVMIVVVQACRKLDDSRKPIPYDPNIGRFLTLPPGTDTTVRVLAPLIRRQHEKRGTIYKLIRNAGFPLWDKAKVFRKGPGDGERIYIPFAKDGKNQTTAVLMVKINNGDTLFHLLYAGHYDDYGFEQNDRRWNGRDIFHVFTSFDYAIFGTKEFTVRDGRLLGYQQKDIAPVKIRIDSVGRGRASARAQTVWEITEWVLYIRCGSCDQPARTMTVACCNATYEWEEVTYWYDDGDDDWGWYTSFSDSESESGGSGPCPGCNWEDSNPCDVEPPYEDLCDPNWQPMPGTPYNPFQYDSVIVEDGLESTYPCWANIIKDSLNNANWIAQMAGHNVFSEQLFAHITFDTSTDYTTRLHNPANTTFDSSAYYDASGHYHFTAKVELNGWYLRNASKEWNISTIVHECMHAVFVMRWAQYQTWLNSGIGNIDSNYIKQKFPIHWYYMVGQQPSEIQQHVIMANDYMDVWMNIGRQFYNPSAPAAIRDSVLMAWGRQALVQTSYWKMLPGLGIDTCKILYYETSAIDKHTTPSQLSGCSGYTPHWQDSLKLRPSCN